MMRLLEANFRKQFPAGPEISIDASLSGEPGSVTVLFGPSGAGKTTVLRCLAGLLRPDAGTIRFGEQLWCDAARRFFLPARKRRIGLVPQDYSLFPHLSVEANIAYGISGVSASEHRARVAEILSWLGLAGLEKRLPRETSGGQQQRVALGRAVAPRPSLLLLDEPLAALDAPTRSRLRGELRGLLRKVEAPMLLVTHDRTDALALGDHLVIMEAGQVIQQGAPAEVFNRPQSAAVANIVGVETVQPGRIIESGELTTVVVGDQKIMAVPGEVSSGTRDVFVSIRAEAVILVKGHAPASSARNALPGIVCRLEPEGPMVRVEVDCGFPLAAFLTKQACSELGLQTSSHVTALIKAPNIHLIPRDATAAALGMG